MDRQELLDRAIAFHGHFCPGLLIGFRAALIAMRALGVERAYDEELVTIAETDACGLDAVQVLTGCTIGKGNLLLRDWGKSVFTFARRSDEGRMLRVALRYGVTNPPGDATLPDQERRLRARDRLLELSDDALYDIRWIDDPLPSRARLFRTVQCSQCGEGVMEARVHLRDGQPVCPQCYGEVYTRRI